MAPKIDVAAMDEVRFAAHMDNLVKDIETKYRGDPRVAQDAATFRQKLVGADTASQEGRAQMLANFKANPQLAEAFLSRDTGPQLRKQMGMTDGAFLNNPFEMSKPQVLQVGGAALQQMNTGQTATGPARQTVPLQRAPSLVRMTEADMVQRLSDNSRAAEARYPELAQQGAAYRAQLTANDPASQQSRAQMLQNYKANPEAAAAHLNPVTPAQLNKYGVDNLSDKLSHPFDMANPGMAKLVNGQIRADGSYNLQRMTQEEMTMRLADHSFAMEAKYPALAGQAQRFRDTLNDPSPQAVAKRETMLNNLKGSPQLAEAYLGPNGAANYGVTQGAAQSFLANPTAFANRSSVIAANTQIAQTGQAVLTAPAQRGWGGPQQQGGWGMGGGRFTPQMQPQNPIVNFFKGLFGGGAAPLPGVVIPRNAPVGTPPFAPPQVATPAVVVPRAAPVIAPVIAPQAQPVAQPGVVATPVTGHTAPVVGTPLPSVGPTPAAGQTPTGQPATPPGQTATPVQSPAQSPAQPPGAEAFDKNKMWEDLQKKFDLDKDKLAAFRANLDANPTSTPASLTTAAATTIKVGGNNP